MKKILKHKKIIIALVVVIAAVAIYLNMNKDKEVPLLPVNTANLEKKSLEQIISVKAPLEGIEKADVVSTLNSKITDITVKEGDLVEKDQVLAVLDSEDLLKEIDAYENQIDLAALEQSDRLRTQQVEYDKFILQLEDMRTTYAQNKELYDNGIITEEAFRKVESSLQEMEKTVQSYNAVDGKIVQNPSEIKQLEIQRQELNRKKEDLDKIYIKSPISGTVTRVNVNIGGNAQNKDFDAMFVVENLSKLQMKVSISEFDIGKVKLGQDVNIISDVLGSETVSGVVARISPTAEMKDSNNLERVIPVTIDVTEKPENLIAGVIATAKIKVDRVDDVLAVPSGAIVSDNMGGYKIFTINEDNTLGSVPVQIGLETDLEAEISGEGLTEGMQYVVNPDYNMVEGTPVAPNNLSAAAE